MKKTNLIKVAFLLFFFSIIIQSCKKDDDSSSPTPQALTTNPSDSTTNPGGGNTSLNSYGFVGDIDGSRFEMIVSSSGNLESGVGSGGQFSSSLSTKTYQSSVYNTLNFNSASISIGEIKYSGTLLPSYSLFMSLFTVGDKDYSVESKNGVEVSIYKSNTLWSSSEGTANQTGSTFTFTKVTEKGNSVEVKATFSCILYDDSGNSKTLTNGEFIGVFENF